MSIESIVKNDLCTGCGVCISEDESKQAKMIWDENGFLVPQLGVNSTQDKMLKVCPFAKQQKNEDELGELFFKNNSQNYHEKLGYYSNLYVGYAKQFRETSSSGGVATYIFKKLLKEKIVDQLFIVKEKNGEYLYQFYSDFEDITKISKTRYIPVTMSELFEKIDTLEGKVAVSGVACFIKAIRLKQYYYPGLKEKIPFVVGIICGGLKSKYYTDFLAQSADCFVEYRNAQYRVKNKDSYALDYNFSCIEKNNNKIHMVEMKKLGDMWGTGLFKSNACDFCDDVVTELADISLGDAWINPYDKDGLGNNIIISRSKIAEKIIQQGLDDQDLCLELICEDKIMQSQSGSFNHRHKGLSYRIKMTETITPNKRIRFISSQNFIFNLVQRKRLETRSKSIEVWKKKKDLNFFHIEMKKSLYELAVFTKMNHHFLRLVKLIKGANTK
ncbi:Coenzyme F420 hydrogenase/dehydrogenase, beta subunit C-terminal domain [Acinetobacter terrestris]|uniref:Coenzyme F420 hydrogenase/dehydrogenase, beta subunit C-terminal domain n=1 Tax=Acinetobacter terrestris TaxID=2529843 RepID=UPI00103CED44|nr:Coenzyme F420 hydrogenase/dehydrogenase, beta subunit C-terminal domain [Acinetobacter terrestris]TCB65704.1 coenzyme F420 hydrogenase [Acinetobacter terrestris]